MSLLGQVGSVYSSPIPRLARKWEGLKAFVWTATRRDASGARRNAAASSSLTVTVVINTLNRRERLKRALRALQRQTYRNFEVVVVNGPSTDGTDNMLSRFRPRVRVAACEEACLGRSRNIGVMLASGEVVVFIDDDAIPSEDWIEELVQPYGDPKIAAVGGPVFDIPLNCVAWGLCTCTRLGHPDTKSEGPIERYLGAGADPFAYLAGCNMSFRRRVLHEVGGFNSLLTYCYDDVEICSRVIDRGYQLHLLDRTLVRHDRDPNVTRDDDRETIRDPYPILYCRAVFVTQCHQPERRREELVGAVQGAATDMRRLADAYRGEGRVTTAEHRGFIAKVRLALADGLKAGSGPRPRIASTPAGHAPLQPYR